MKLAHAVAATLLVASPVPVSVQRAISKELPAYLRYVPNSVPPGYRYARWHKVRSGLEIYFARTGRPPTLVFLAGAAGRPGQCTLGSAHTYRFGSVRVSFETDRYSEQFWRCVGGGTISIEATVSRADGLTAARQRSIAAMVASAKQLG